MSTKPSIPDDPFAAAVGVPVEHLTKLDGPTLEVAAKVLAAAGGCDRAVSLLREMAQKEAA